MTDSENNVNENDNKSVQEKLLNSAEELFCERGFEGTSIRDIAASAGCNIASVNYYFGGKQQLYEQVWKRHLIPMRDIRIASIEKITSQKNPKPSLEDLVKSFTETSLGSVFEAKKFDRLNKLMAREYISRHLPANMFLDEVMMPTVTSMQKALIETFPDLDESHIPHIVFSLIGQLVHLVHIRAMFEESEDNSTRKMFYSDEIINHIVKFSCAGIRAYLKGKK
jgi:TetR/AcrR family transcriptional regulator, regulator of cefoperazone and chloramphenicol sensitivity